MPPNARGVEARAGSCSETDLPIPIPPPLRPPKIKRHARREEGIRRFSRDVVSAMPEPMPSRVDPMLRKTAPSGASALGLAMAF